MLSKVNTLVLSAYILPLAAIAQQPTAASPATAVANPTYVSIRMEVTVNKPAADVWKRVGKYCDIAEYAPFPLSCKITAGADGEVGAVRTLGSSTREILVGRTDLSYTYTAPVREGRPYNLYHGTVEARPMSGKTSQLIYTLMFDNSMLADDAARQADIESKRTTFTALLNNMKTLAEGGTLPAPKPPIW